jgi:parallel beta-helix repeat protein
MGKISWIIVISIFFICTQSINAADVTVCPAGCNSTTIQGAVDAASSGDTVLVSNGSYNENVDVYKSINIRSVNGTNLTTVNASDRTDNGFYVNATNVNISGFTVTGADDNSGFSTPAAIRLYNASYCNISNNRLIENYRGISIYYYSANNTFTGNNISGNSNYGIAIFTESNDNLIYNNNFSNNAGGNARDISNSNFWNTTRTLGTNIIRGPNLGGNYWDDYIGLDNGSSGRVAGDGIGDTSLPHTATSSISSGGDWLPLVIPDLRPPKISNVRNASVSDTSATITWITDESSASLVKFNTSSGSYKYNKSKSSLETFHRTVLTGLSPNTTYYYVVNSTDISQNSNQSAEYSFTTGNMYTVCKPSGCDYTSIQAAINDLSMGDRIYVFNGTYNENVVVNKSLTIQGEDKDTTIIDCDGSGNCVYVDNTDGTNISGFTIQNGSHGINVNSSDFTTITNNKVKGNTYYGIFLASSNYGIISDNDATDNKYYYGIGISNSNDTTIENNNASDNWYGIYVLGSCDNIVENNTANNNLYTGIYLSSFTCTYPTYSNNIINNTFTGSYFGFLGISISNVNYSYNNFGSIYYVDDFLIGSSNTYSDYNFPSAGGAGSPSGYLPGTRLLVDETWQSGSDNTSYKLYIDNFGFDTDTIDLNITNASGAAISLDSSSATLKPGETITRMMTVGDGTVGDYEIIIETISQNDSSVRDNVKTTTIVTGSPSNDSVIQNSVISGSTIIESAFYNSNITNSNITRSIINNSIVINTSLEDVKLDNANVTNSIISDGNITVGGIKYQINTTIALLSLIIGSDLEDSTIVGVEGTELDITALNANLTFQISAGKDYIGGEMKVQRATVQPIVSTAQTNNLGGYTYVIPSENLEGNIDWVYIVVYYNQSELDAKNLSESSLELQFYNETSQAWETISPGGVNTTGDYVWANSSHFSVLGLRGDIKPGKQPIKYSSGGVYIPSVIPATGKIVISPSDVDDLIQQFKFSGYPFYTTDTVLSGPLGALGIFTVPFDLVDRVNTAIWAKVQNLSGDVYEISSRYVLGNYLYGAGKVIIARGDLEVDSIAVVAYARLMRIPILLVEPENIPESTQSALSLLGAEQPIIVGGTEAISEKVEEELPINGIRIGGEDRYETAVKIAEALMSVKDIDTVVITDGENPNKVSIMIAVYYNAPILYTKGDELPTWTESFLEENSFDRIVLVGVSEAVEGKINSPGV